MRRARRTVGLLVALVGLVGVALWLTIPWTRTAPLDGLPGAAAAEGVLARDPLPPSETLRSVQRLTSVSTGRTDALRSTPSAEPADSDAPAPRPIARAHQTTLTGLSGHVDLYVDGRLTDARLNGSIDVKTDGGPWTTIQLVESQFELVFHRQIMGDYATGDGGMNVGFDLERVRFQVAAPRVEGMDPVLLYYPETGAPRRAAESFPFGTLDAAVTVTEAPALELDVVESGTGLHLDQVSVVAVSDQGRMITQQPGVGELQLASLEASPLRLIPGDPLSHSVFAILAVSAPGYGTEVITVNFTQGHRRVVELSAAGGLVVHIDGELPTGSELLIGARGQRFLPCPATSDEMSFGSLVPTTYVISLLADGDRATPPMWLASGRVEIRPKEIAELTLVIPDVEDVVRADLVGILVLPQEWNIDDKQVRGQLLGNAVSPDSWAFVLRNDDLSPIAGRSGSYSFEKGNLEVGRYLLEFEALNVQVVADLPRGGVHDVELIVAPPVNITVVTENADANESSARQPDMVYWCPKPPEGAQGSSSKSVYRDAASGKFHLVVPAGEVSIRPGGMQDPLASLDVFATEGLEVTLTVSSPMTVTIELRDGDIVIPWPASQGMEYSHADGKPGGASYSPGRTPTLRAHRPGTYLVKIPDMDGYSSHEDVVVEMTSGPTRTIIVSLTPR